MREPDTDNPLLADDDCANNHFEFEEATAPTGNPSGRDQCSDTTFPPSPGDPGGDRCPFAAHIRKSYPRDDLPEVPGYALLDVLGEGGMGVVYRARHLALRREVALKMVLARKTSGPAHLMSLAARFQRRQLPGPAQGAGQSG